MDSDIYDEGIAAYTLEDCLSNGNFSTSCIFNDYARDELIINQEVGDNSVVR